MHTDDRRHHSARQARVMAQARVSQRARPSAQSKTTENERRNRKVALAIACCARHLPLTGWLVVAEYATRHGWRGLSQRNFA